MKKHIKTLILFFLVVLSTGALIAQEEIIWVPISLGGITFFVPYSAGTDPDPVEPPIVIPPDPIVDANLRACIDSENVRNNWIYDYEVTSLYCTGRGINSLVGVNSLVNLELFYLNQNNISDLTPLIGLTNLRTLGATAYNETNQIYNAQIAAIKSMSSIENLEVFSFAPPNRLLPVAFQGGFVGLQTLTIKTIEYFECPLMDYLQQERGLILNQTLFLNDDPPGNLFINC